LNACSVFNLGGEGAEIKEKFTTSMIKTKSFRSGEDLKAMLNNLKFEKV
jgi:hypothetical protein